MRGYAMLLGLALTAGYAYAAQVAVSSVQAGHVEAAPIESTKLTPSYESLWYGGTLDPITVEARGDSPAKTATARRLLLDRVSVRCSQVSHIYHTAL